MATHKHVHYLGLKNKIVIYLKPEIKNSAAHNPKLNIYISNKTVQKIKKMIKKYLRCDFISDLILVQRHQHCRICE